MEYQLGVALGLAAGIGAGVLVIVLLFKKRILSCAFGRAAGAGPGRGV